jgi:HEAT repeat protein
MRTFFLASLATSHWPATAFGSLAAPLLLAGCSREDEPQSQATAASASFTRAETSALTPPSINQPGNAPVATRTPAPLPRRAPNPFQYQNWGPREMAVDSLGRMGTTALPSLIELLRDPDPEMRVLAAKAISRIGPEAAEAVPPLVAAMNDNNPDVRKHVIRALGQIGPKASASIPALVQELRDKQQATAIPVP